MKKDMIHIFATTGLSLLLLSIIARFYRAEFLCIDTVFQVFFVNLVVHLALLFVYHLNIEHMAFVIVTEIILIVSLPLLFGAIFHWYTSTPVFVLVPMSIVIYIISSILNIVHMKREADEINKLIQTNKENLKA